MPTEQQNKIRVTEYLDLDLEREQWLCNRCGHDSGPGAAKTTRRAACSTTAIRAKFIRRLSKSKFSFSPDPHVGAHCGILLSAVRHADGDGISAAGPSHHLGHRDRYRYV